MISLFSPSHDVHVGGAFPMTSCCGQSSVTSAFLPTSLYKLTRPASLFSFLINRQLHLHYPENVSQAQSLFQLHLQINHRSLTPPNQTHQTQWFAQKVQSPRSTTRPRAARTTLSLSSRRTQSRSGRTIRARHWSMLSTALTSSSHTGRSTSLQAEMRLHHQTISQ
jgi:hypothetical protein